VSRDPATLHRSRAARAGVAQVRFTRIRRETTGVLFVLPTVAVMLAVIGYPVLETLRLSVSQVALGQDATPFVGLANYTAVVSDRAFATAFRNTIVWTVLSVVLVLVLGVLTGLLVNEKLPGRGLIRSLLLVPWIVPAIVVSVVWK
jgi:multiple sugar transport system permease protein